MSGSLQLSHGSSEKLAKQNLSGESDPVEVQKYQLDGVKGAVCTTQKVTIPPFQTLTLKGNAGIKGHCMKVHVLTEPALGPQLLAAVVPIATYGELHPGSSRVPICLCNMSLCAVEVPAKTVVGQVTPANQVPGGPPNQDYMQTQLPNHIMAGSWRLWISRAYKTGLNQSRSRLGSCCSNGSTCLHKMT